MSMVPARRARAEAPARATGLGVLGCRIARTVGWHSAARAGAGGARAARGHHRYRRLSSVTARSARHAGAASVARRQMAGCRTARAGFGVHLCWVLNKSIKIGKLKNPTLSKSYAKSLLVVVDSFAFVESTVNLNKFI